MCRTVVLWQRHRIRTTVQGVPAGWGCPLFPASAWGVQDGSLPIAPFFLTGICWAPCECLETFWVSWDLPGSPSIHPSLLVTSLALSTNKCGGLGGGAGWGAPTRINWCLLTNC